MSTDPDGKISVKTIAKAFASGRTERLVYQTLASMNLPSDKVTFDSTTATAWPTKTQAKRVLSFLAFQVEAITPEDFTFEKFYEFYSKICPRNDIEELYREM